MVDGIGALLSVFFLAAILGSFEEQFGMPQGIVYALAVPASIFAIYSFGCFYLAGENWSILLRIIATANLLYCCVTIVLVFYHFTILTWLGITYFLLEIVVIVALVSIEFILSSKQKADFVEVK